MFSMKLKFVVLLLTVGLLAACAGPAVQIPPSSPATFIVPTATDMSMDIPTVTNTSAPVLENTATSQPVNGAMVSFANDILPILQSRCINCHGGDRTEEGLVLKTYADILAGSKNGAVVIPGDAVNSLLAQLVANQKMPKRGPKLTPPQVQLIIDWINQGALDN